MHLGTSATSAAAAGQGPLLYMQAMPLLHLATCTLGYRQQNDNANVNKSTMQPRTVRASERAFLG